MAELGLPDPGSSVPISRCDAFWTYVEGLSDCSAKVPQLNPLQKAFSSLRWAERQNGEVRPRLPVWSHSVTSLSNC